MQNTLQLSRLEYFPQTTMSVTERPMTHPERDCTLDDLLYFMAYLMNVTSDSLQTSLYSVLEVKRSSNRTLEEEDAEKHTQ